MLNDLQFIQKPQHEWKHSVVNEWNIVLFINFDIYGNRYIDIGAWYRYICWSVIVANRSLADCCFFWGWSNAIWICLMMKNAARSFNTTKNASDSHKTFFSASFFSKCAFVKGAKTKTNATKSNLTFQIFTITTDLYCTHEHYKT